MDMYFYMLVALMGGFAMLLFVSEIIYEVLVYIVKKIDERSKVNE